MPLSHLGKTRVNARHAVIYLGASLVHCIPLCGRDYKYRENYRPLILIRGQKSMVTVNNIHVPSNQETPQILCFTKTSKKSIKDIVL